MSRLILTRKVGQTACIGSNVTITILGYSRGQVRFIVDAPSEIAVDREEVRERKEREPGFRAGAVK
jgi:carbon storage regulator